MNLTPFARLLGLQRRQTARERLHDLRHKHALTDSDPLWELVAIVEEFCADLAEEAKVPNLPPSAASSPPVRTLQWEDHWRIAVLGAAAAGVQALLLAASFAAGMRSVRANDWVTATLTVPAGWVVVLLVLPLFGALTAIGWANRRNEPLVGRTLVLFGSAATVAIFAAIWMLLTGTGGPQ